MEIINFDNVSFSYPLANKEAIKNVDVKILPSDFVLVCGKSGCGKSTFLRLMKQELTPDGDLLGKVSYRGTSIDKLNPYISASEIGFVHQSPEKQIVTDKVWHELAFGLESLGMSTEVIRRRVAEMASFFGIQTWFRKNVVELSGGQKQLLNLASVMAMYPKVLILDEPTSELDPIASTEFISILRKINLELGTTIILSEHRLEEIFPIVDKVLLMEDGKVQSYGTPLEVGKFLGFKGKNHPMYEGLPTAMKIYSEIYPKGNCPVTVRDGKLWLSNLLDNNPIIQEVPYKNESNRKEPIIEIKNVWFRYSKKSNDVIRDLSLIVNKGELFSIIGGNGVGKSTLLKLITGTNKPYRGKIKINRKNIKKYKYEELFTENLSMLPQNPMALFTEISVLEEMLDMMEDYKISDEEKLEKANNMLYKLGLLHLSDMHPYDLSGGEQQRLALGKVLLLKPKILLLDEPTKGLDPFYKNILAKIFKNLKKNGVTIIMITHDIEFCAEYSDKVAMLFDGTVISQGTPRELFSGNSFYTTASNRMSKHLFKNAITYKDVIYLCDQNMTQNAIG